MSEKQTITQAALLKIANQLITEHPNYISGMHANFVVDKNDVLVFSGDYFLDENGLPTEKTTQVFNMFKYLAHQLSNQYRLIE